MSHHNNAYHQMPQPPDYSQPPHYGARPVYGQPQYGPGPNHQHWYGQHPSTGGPHAYGDTKKTRQRSCMYRTLRQFSLIVPFVIIILNINIYASHRGRYERTIMTAEDPVFYDLWLTVPLAAVVLIWAFVNLAMMRRERYRGDGIPLHVQFGVELMLSLGTAVCWVLLITQIVSKQNSNVYEYPILRYEAPLAFLLGLLMFVEFALCGTALSAFNSDRKSKERGGLFSV